MLLLTGIGEFVAGGAVHVSEAVGRQRINAGYVPFSGEHYMLGEGGGASASGGGNAGGADSKNEGGNHQEKQQQQQQQQEEAPPQEQAPPYGADGVGMWPVQKNLQYPPQDLRCLLVCVFASVRTCACVCVPVCLCACVPVRVRMRACRLCALSRISVTLYLSGCLSQCVSGFLVNVCLSVSVCAMCVCVLWSATIDRRQLGGG